MYYFIITSLYYYMIHYYIIILLSNYSWMSDFCVCVSNMPDLTGCGFLHVWVLGLLNSDFAAVFHPEGARHWRRMSVGDQLFNFFELFGNLRKLLCDGLGGHGTPGKGCKKVFFSTFFNFLSLVQVTFLHMVYIQLSNFFQLFCSLQKLLLKAESLL